MTVDNWEEKLKEQQALSDKLEEEEASRELTIDSLLDSDIYEDLIYISNSVVTMWRLLTHLDNTMQDVLYDFEFPPDFDALGRAIADLKDWPEYFDFEDDLEFIIDTISRMNNAKLLIEIANANHTTAGIFHAACYTSAVDLLTQLTPLVTGSVICTSELDIFCGRTCLLEFITPLSVEDLGSDEVAFSRLKEQVEFCRGWFGSHSGDGLRALGLAAVAEVRRATDYLIRHPRIVARDRRLRNGYGVIVASSRKTPRGRPMIQDPDAERIWSTWQEWTESVSGKKTYIACADILDIKTAAGRSGEQRVKAVVQRMQKRDRRGRENRGKTADK